MATPMSLQQLIPVLRKDAVLLRSIANGEPDGKLSGAENRAVPRLRKWGWLQVCGCSDGDYVVVTDRGRKILDQLGEQAA